MKIIAVTNQKGGVGKTTLAFHLAVSLSESGFDTLAVDMDPQGNLTYTFQEELPENAHVHNLFENEEVIPFQTHLADGKLYLVGSDIRLSRFETDTRFENFYKLKRFLNNQNYDFVIVDTPPSLGLFTANSLVAATHVIVPMDVSVFAALGLEDLLETIGKISEYANTNPKVVGIVIMGQLGRTTMGQTVASSLKEQYGDLILGEISHSIKVREAVSLGRPVWEHAPDHKVSKEFREIIERIMERIK